MLGPALEQLGFFVIASILFYFCDKNIKKSVLAASPYIVSAAILYFCF